MKFNYLSITFWFNVYDNHNDLLKILQVELKDIFSNFNVTNPTNNLINPVIVGVNNDKRMNLQVSQINMQFNMDDINKDSLETFKNISLQLFDILNKADVNVLRTAMMLNCEFDVDDSLSYITDNIVNSNIVDDDLVDTSMTFGKKHEDLFYKTITVMNKKRIKFTKQVDENNIPIPLPLISWNGAYVESDLVEVSYEINDKYLYDFTKDYRTTEFYLNKMLYILCEYYEIDINNLLKKGTFN